MKKQALPTASTMHIQDPPVIQQLNVMLDLCSIHAPNVCLCTQTKQSNNCTNSYQCLDQLWSKQNIVHLHAN